MVGHLTDHDFVRFFAACGRGLRQGGVVVLKDNCASGCVMKSSAYGCVQVELSKFMFSLNLRNLSVTFNRINVYFPMTVHHYYLRTKNTFAHAVLCVLSWTFVIDRSDRSVARSKEYQLALFRQARLRVVMQRSQEGFPDELYPVLMTALALDVEC